MHGRCYFYINSPIALNVQVITYPHTSDLDLDHIIYIVFSIKIQNRPIEFHPYLFLSKNFITSLSTKFTATQYGRPVILHIPFSNPPPIGIQTLLPNQKTTLQETTTKPTFSSHYWSPPSLKTPSPSNFP